jgi:anaerobic dimethyl sulfoxide reductase subunit B (iron-sulfur subunit)
MTKQMAFYFEQKHCSGCCTCQIACKDKNNLKVGQMFRKVHEYSGGGFWQEGAAVVQDVYAFWLSISCNHCGEPACVKNCPTGALQKRMDDGIVVIDSEKCIGCCRCVKSCPYGSLQYDLGIGKVRKCDFCLDLLSKGEVPACVAACPMRALDYGVLGELRKKYGTVDQTRGMPSAANTEPSLVISPHRSAT